MKIIGIIPARFQSTRLPGKPLLVIDGKSMLQRVYEQSLKAKCLSKVIVATDDERIKKHILSFGGNVVMTATTHQSGTDRCCEAIEKWKEKYDIVINIQGDEPFINPLQIEQVANCFKSKKTQIATLIKEISEVKELFDINKPKVIINSENEAIYFSRSPLPHLRNRKKNQWLQHHSYYKHIGIYAYRTAILKKISKLNQSKLELAESLEQLRWLENGYKIKTTITKYNSYSVDTLDDIKKIKLLLKSNF